MNELTLASRPGLVFVLYDMKQAYNVFKRLQSDTDGTKNKHAQPLPVCPYESTVFKKE
jgi:hypothetical protein